MTTQRILRLCLLSALIGAPAITVGQANPSWTQWGGPGRNFMSASKGLASSWPTPGREGCGAGASARATPRSWSRADVSTPCIGSSPTQARAGRRARRRPRRGQRQDDLGVQVPLADERLQFIEGAGPQATPLIAGNRMFATSSRSELFALDKATGKRIWSHDLDQGIQRAAHWTRLQRQPAPLQRHHHRDDGRAPIRRWRRSTRTPASWCGRPVTSCAPRRRRC